MGGTKKKVKASLVPDDSWVDVISDNCIICGDGGDILVCDTCPRGYHKDCVETGGPKDGKEGNKWSCDICKSRPWTEVKDEKKKLEQIFELCRAFPANHLASILGDQLRANYCFDRRHGHLPRRDVADTLRDLWRGGASKPATAAQKFLRMGLTQPHPPGNTSLRASQVRDLAEIVETTFNVTLRAIASAQVGEGLEAGGFVEVKLRGRGRYDLQVPALESPKFSFLHRDDTPWMPVVKELLGGKCKRIHSGAFVSMPGADVQGWHSDGVHLAQKEHRPPHAVNVFIPLADLDLSMGPTEFVPGSHILGEYNSDATPLVLKMGAGDSVLFDYRVKHRGLANTSTRPRVLLYLTYAVPGFKDADNFGQKRYPPLPKAAREAIARDMVGGTREARLAQRALGPAVKKLKPPSSSSASAPSTPKKPSSAPSTPKKPSTSSSSGPPTPKRSTPKKAGAGSPLKGKGVKGGHGKRPLGVKGGVGKPKGGGKPAALASKAAALGGAAGKAAAAGKAKAKAAKRSAAGGGSKKPGKA